MRLIKWLIIILFLTGCIEIDRCSKLDQQNIRDDCYFERAIETNNYRLCDRIKLSTLKWSCKSKIAISKQDLSKCYELQSSKDYCLEKIAEIKNNLTICRDISTQYWHDLCYKKFGIKTNNPKLCFEIYNIEDIDECLKEIALSTKNESLCYEMYLPKNKIYCFVNISIAKMDEKVCKGIKNDILRYGICVTKVAKLKNDSSICKKIPLTKIRDICLEKLS